MRRLLFACALALPGLAQGFAARAACPADAAIADYAAALISGRPTEPMSGLSMADAACARDKLVPIPINRTTLNELFGLDLKTDEEAADYLASRAEPVEDIGYDYALGDL